MKTFKIPRPILKLHRTHQPHTTQHTTHHTPHTAHHTPHTAHHTPHSSRLNMMKDEFQVPLNKMSEVATNRLIWKRNFGIDIKLQPLITLEDGDTTAQVSVRGNTNSIKAFKYHLTQEGLI